MRTLESLQYPIGRFEYGKQYTDADFKVNIDRIQQLPKSIASCIASFQEDDWKRPYRPGGWNARQLIHHLGDSHVNGYIRIQFALSERNPVIKPYNENDWVVQENENFDITEGLAFLASVQRRMAETLLNASLSDRLRCYFHPELNRHVSLYDSAANYAFHGEHHLAHLKIIQSQI